MENTIESIDMGVTSGRYGKGMIKKKKRVRWKYKSASDNG